MVVDCILRFLSGRKGLKMLVDCILRFLNGRKGLKMMCEVQPKTKLNPRYDEGAEEMLT